MNDETVSQETDIQKAPFVPRQHINIILPEDPADANRCEGCE